MANGVGETGASLVAVGWLASPPVDVRREVAVLEAAVTPMAPPGVEVDSELGDLLAVDAWFLTPRATVTWGGDGLVILCVGQGAMSS